MKSHHPLRYLTIAVLSALPLLQAESLVVLEAEVAESLRLETEQLAGRNLDRRSFALGTLQRPPGSSAVLASRISGQIIEIAKPLGSQVTKGELLLRIESRQAVEPRISVPVYAPASGVLTRLEVALGEPVEPEMKLGEISDTSHLLATAQVPQSMIPHIKPGSRAWIKIPALGNGQLESSVYKLGLEADSSLGTMEVQFLLPNPDKRLRPGMRAEFEIAIEPRAGILAVPREAVQGDPLQRVVFVKSDKTAHAFEQRNVELGDTFGPLVEIRSGLRQGDWVVTKGAYALTFAGGRGASLKEALDAAHGHTHAEDGSEPEEGSHDAHEHEGRGAPTPNAKPGVHEDHDHEAHDEDHAAHDHAGHDHDEQEGHDHEAHENEVPANKAAEPAPAEASQDFKEALHAGHPERPWQWATGILAVLLGLSLLLQRSKKKNPNT